MAKIPVKRKQGGMPWWAWLLIALAVFVLIWLLFSFFNDEPATEPIEPIPESSPEARVGEGLAMTPLTVITAPVLADEFGRQVRLETVQVQRSTGDKSLWLGPSKDQQLLVLLQEIRALG
jgi:hypothetical protein